MSTAEVDLYDRQIRVWGLEAQNNIRKFKVLMIGCNQISSEILKNLCLSGVQISILKTTGKYTDILESCLLGEEYLNENYSDSLVDAMTKMNPTSSFSVINEISDQYDLVCCCEDFDIEAVYDQCLKSNIKFYFCYTDNEKLMADCDLLCHEYLIKGQIEKLECPKLSFALHNTFTASPASNAVFGGMIAQEIIKIASKAGRPLINHLEYDPNTLQMNVIFNK